SAFERAWQRVLDRHAVLRTSFYWKELDKPLQLVHRHVPIPVEQHDWSGRSPVDQQESLKSFLRKDRHRGFDLAHAPLMRLIIIRLAEDVHYFIWSFHHVLLDGWSVVLILQEVFASYEAFRRGGDLPL